MPYLAALKALNWRMLGLCAAAFAILALFAHDRIQVAKVGKLKAQVEQCASDRRADRRAYEDAQAAAALKNKAEVARIEKEQGNVTNEVSRNLNLRLERLRRELQQKAPAAGGSSRGPAAGADGKPRAGADEEAGLCLAPDELLRAAESEERHDRLIDWIEQQLKIQR
jgi:hypothetical protein